jgi:hypothetical protein
MEFTKAKVIEQVVWKSGINTGGADVVTGILRKDNIDIDTNTLSTTTPVPSRPLFEQLAAHRIKAEEEAIKNIRPKYNTPQGLDDDEIRFLEEQAEIREEKEEKERLLDLNAKEEYETATLFSTASNALHTTLSTSTTSSLSYSEGSSLLVERQKEEEKKRLINAAGKSALSVSNGNGGGGINKQNKHRPLVLPLVMKKGEISSTASTASNSTGISCSTHIMSESSHTLSSNDLQHQESIKETKEIGYKRKREDEQDDQDNSIYNTVKVDTMKRNDIDNEKGSIYDNNKERVQVGGNDNVVVVKNVVKLPPPPFLKRQERKSFKTSVADEGEALLTSTTTATVAVAATTSKSKLLLEYDEDE